MDERKAGARTAPRKQSRPRPRRNINRWIRCVGPVRGDPRTISVTEETRPSIGINLWLGDYSGEITPAAGVFLTVHQARELKKDINTILLEIRRKTKS